MEGKLAIGDELGLYKNRCLELAKQDDAKTLAVNLLMAELLDEIPAAQLVRIVQSIRNVVADGEKLRPSKLPSYDALVSELTVMLFEGDEDGESQPDSPEGGVWVEGDGQSPL